MTMMAFIGGVLLLLLAYYLCAIVESVALILIKGLRIVKHHRDSLAPMSCISVAGIPRRIICPKSTAISSGE